MSTAPLRTYDLGIIPDIPVGPAYERASDGKIVEATRLNGDGWITRGELFVDEAGHAQYRQLEHFKLKIVENGVQLDDKATRAVAVTAAKARAKTKAVESERAAARKRKRVEEAENAERRKLAPDGTADEVDPMQFFELGSNGRLTFRPALLGKFLENENPIRVGIDHKLWRFDDSGVWLPDGEEWAQSRMREILGKEYKRSPKEEVIDWLQGGQRLNAEPSLIYLNLVNGLLDWKTKTLIEHDPDLSSMIRIPVSWNPKAQCPTFEQFLTEVLPPDAIDFVWEVIGYTLYPQNRFQRAILLNGPGGNGKGTLLDVITALLGDANVSAKTLHQLSDDRFAAADLFGRLANICGDLDSRTVERSDLFKMLTGRDLVDAQHKHKHAFKFRFFGKALFSANEIPPTADQSDGYFDRWLVVPMINRIRGTAKEKPNMTELLTTPEELEGILVKAVTALQGLMKRGHFDVPESVRAASDRMRAEQDTVRAFVETCCVVGGEQLEIVHSNWYGGYALWCRQNGRKPLSMIRATRRLMEANPNIVKEMNRARTAQVLTGICKGSEWPVEEYVA